MSILNRLVLFNAPSKQGESISTSRFLLRNYQTNSKKKVTMLALTKYLSFVKSYDINLKKKFPTATKFYQKYSVSLRYFANDVMILFKALKKVTSDGLNSLSRKELEIYFYMPKDILRTAPTLLLASLPGGALIFAVAHYFPKYMLTHHFWSEQQRTEYSLLTHKKKLRYYKPILGRMQESFSTKNNTSLNNPMLEIFQCLRNGAHPSADEILLSKPLFESAPYGLQYLSRSHVVELLKLHDMHRGWGRRKRLYDRANFIQLMDLAIIREGGIEMLNQDEIKWNCFFRGLNPVNVNNEETLMWLKTWLIISQSVTENSFSLLLHCPILLGYNYPSNWSLLHCK